MTRGALATRSRGVAWIAPLVVAPIVAWIVPLIVPSIVAPIASGAPVSRLASAPSLFTPRGGPLDVGPPPRGLSGVAPADCAACHAEIAAEWASSAHALTWTNKVFLAEYRRSRDGFCRDCHAPLVRAQVWDRVSAPLRAGHAPLPLVSPALDREVYALATRGVDCAACHVREGRVLGARGHGEADHAARRDARLATGDFCGGCHQFRFPAPEPARPLLYHPEEALQKTVAEWKRSRLAGRPCQGCHMPVVRKPDGTSYKSHAFAAFRDPAFLASAVSVEVTARRRGAKIFVVATLSPGEIGHAFPTGDMFRRAVFTVRVGAATASAELRRYFAPTMTADGRRHLLGEVDDTRVPAPGAGPPRRLRFTLDAAPAEGVTDLAWQLDLFRLDPSDAKARALSDADVRAQVRAGRAAIR